MTFEAQQGRYDADGKEVGLTMDNNEDVVESKPKIARDRGRDTSRDVSESNSDGGDGCECRRPFTCDHHLPFMANRATAPRPLPTSLLVGLVPVACWYIFRPFLDPVPPLPALYTSFGLSIFALLATLYLIPALGPTFIKAKLFGHDLLKTYRHEVQMSVQFHIQSSTS